MTISDFDKEMVQFLQFQKSLSHGPGCALFAAIIFHDAGIRMSTDEDGKQFFSVGSAIISYCPFCGVKLENDLRN